MKINCSKYLVCSFLSQFLLISVLFANQIPTQNDITKVNRLVENKNFPAAMNIYRDWVATGFESKRICYNLALLHENMGNIGYAMFYLKKAKKVAPEDDLVNKRITILQEKIKDRFMIPIKSDRFIDVLWKPWEYWRLEEAGTFLLISFWICSLYLLSFKIFFAFKKLNFFKPILYVQLGLICFLMVQSIRISYKNNQREAIILGKVVDIYEGADKLSPKIQTVHAGLPVLFEYQIGDWIKVKLYNGQVGWLKKNQLSAII